MSTNRFGLTWLAYRGTTTTGWDGSIVAGSDADVPMPIVSSGVLPSEGSGTATVVGAAVGQGYTLHYGNGAADATTLVVGRGYVLHYGSGAADAAASAVGQGYILHYGYGSASSVAGAVGEGLAPAGAANGSGVATAIGSAIGEGYRTSSGSGVADVVGLIFGTGQSEEPQEESITGTVSWGKSKKKRLKVIRFSDFAVREDLVQEVRKSIPIPRPVVVQSVEDTEDEEFILINMLELIDD